jgi:hypothetical protein
MSQYNIFITRILCYKRLNRTLSIKYSSGTLHNSTGNQLGVITHLELLIEESQIFFSF